MEKTKLTKDFTSEQFGEESVWWQLDKHTANELLCYACWGAMLRQRTAKRRDKHTEQCTSRRIETICQLILSVGATSGNFELMRSAFCSCHITRYTTYLHEYAIGKLAQLWKINKLGRLLVSVKGWRGIPSTALQCEKRGVTRSAQKFAFQIYSLKV